ncbi:MAG: hypothetical protein WCF16_11470, partial [Alphaproteobacteria bacterium]
MMADTDPCEICGEPTATALRSGDRIKYTCPRCQTYFLTGSARAVIGKLDRKQRATASGWIFEQNARGVVPIISSEILNSLTTLSPPPLSERADKMLLSIVRRQSTYGERFSIHEKWLLAASYSMDVEEVAYVAKVLETSGYFKFVGIGGIA